MSAHTPGPWLIVQDDDFAGLSIRSGNERDASHISYLQICADINGLRKKSEKYADTEAQANARLIAAAPDMYEALKIARDYMSDAISYAQRAFEGHEETGGIPLMLEELAQVDAALAKASQ